MSDEFKQKSLKLLADPYKIKNTGYNHSYGTRGQDKLKDVIEQQFQYDINDRLYNVIIKDIKTSLIIDSVLQNIITQVNLDQSP